MEFECEPTPRMPSMDINSRLRRDMNSSLSSNESVETFKTLNGSLGSKKEDILMKHYLSNKKIKKVSDLVVVLPQKELPII